MILKVGQLPVPSFPGQVLNLDRPWRERRDMLSGILTAASVADRRKVVENLDQRFEQHAEIDDFEIVAWLPAETEESWRDSEILKNVYPLIFVIVFIQDASGCSKYHVINML